MFQIVNFPSAALGDIRSLIQLSEGQLSTLANLLNSPVAVPPVDQAFEDMVREQLKLDAENAEAVVRVSLVLQSIELTAEQGGLVVDDFVSLIRKESPEDEQELIDEIDGKREALGQVAVQSAAIDRALHMRRIASGTQPSIDSIRTLVQLRPFFTRDENDKPGDVECLIPAMTLELKYNKDDRDHSATFSLSETKLDELIASLEDAKAKWQLLKTKFDDQICEQ